jgi:peptidoglycan hydrolase FlgJ
MQIGGIQSVVSQLAPVKPREPDPKVRETFDQFVGETFYGQMLQSLRKTVGKTPYFNGGRGEEIFRGQLDQTLAQNMAKADGGRFSGSMFDLFSLQRS